MEKVEIQERTKKLFERADKPEEFVKELQNFLNSCTDKEATKNYLRIIPDAGKLYGVPKPVLVVIAKEIGRFIQRKPDRANELLSIIWQEGSWEAKQIAGKSLEKFGPEYPDICLDFIKTCLDDIDNWSVCDNLAMFGVEPIAYHNPGLILPLSERWINSKNRWIRRFGVVTLRGYRKVKVTSRVFELLDKVMKDKDKDVKKAVSWVLREITKKNPDEIAEFLIRWAKVNPNKDTIWIIKDGMKKLSSLQQQRILRLLN
jgi:3-methyladenine DNA glycosylase AlkD